MSSKERTYRAKQRADEPENNFSSLAVGGTNLIRNADTLEGWSSRHATETYLGDRVAYTRLAKGASGYTQLDEQTLDVTGRTEFVFSFYAKGAYDGQEMASYFYNPSNTTTTKPARALKAGPVTARRSRN
ncbi:hypothetical protein [Klebsiella pneumoniae]|uniref:hypothetical protein n=1 Tax=Klebsiella pneumoniae TaxID=573 RepID=UPI003AEF6BA7